MRFRAPARGEVEDGVFAAPVFAAVAAWRRWLTATDWPSVAALDAAADALRADAPALRFVEQTPEMLADGLHYEQRIAERGAIATRACNWHDLFNALIWLRHPQLKRALNARQIADIAAVGPRQRTRGQCALTHFDEAGVVVVLRDAARLAAWDRHDWPALFADLEQQAFAVAVFGHALLEHALEPGRLLCGKALVALADDPAAALPGVLDALAGRIASGALLNDPQELRPAPLMGLPGWHPQAGEPAFLSSAECFQPLRAGRRYPAPLEM